MNFIRIFKYIAVYLVLLTLMAAIGLGLTILPEPLLTWFFAEHGLIEGLTVLLYGVAICLLFFYGRTASLQSHWYLYALLAALSMRELDFDKKFTTMGILKSRFFFSDSVPAPEKMIAAPILLFLLAAILTWAYKHFTPYIKSVFRPARPAWVLGFGFVLIVLSKTIDGIERKLEDFNIAISVYAVDIFEHIEELYELGIPVAFILAVTATWSAANHRQKTA